MDPSTAVIEYKCPCCDAGLTFSSEKQELTCDYCGNTFETDAVQAYNDSKKAYADQPVQWDEIESFSPWDSQEQAQLNAFQCPSCGGEILCEATTAATFCPYCDNPTILPSRLSGSIRPDGVIPFQKTREDAKAAFLHLCKGKPLLPKAFTEKQHIEHITGLYVPFWLYDCQGDFQGTYRATRVRSWSDSNYTYTKTSHYLLQRAADADFVGIPMDGSSKMDDTFMESIEPYDYKGMVPFDMAYLSGFLADKYDVPSEAGDGRIRQRVDNAIREQLHTTMLGYTSVLPAGTQLKIKASRARYVLMPVWILNTRYKDRVYTFAMNGQTGKMTGAFPVCIKRTIAWAAGIFLAAASLVSLIQWLL